MRLLPPALGPTSVCALALWSLCLFATPEGLAQTGSQTQGRGPAVIDSATLEFAGKRVRLLGLHGLAQEDSCSAGTLTWPCGREARWAAQNRVGRHWVVCVEQARAAEAAILAVCYLGGVGGPELNAWLVEQGWARAVPAEGVDYRPLEDAARSAGRGLWRGL